MPYRSLFAFALLYLAIALAWQLSWLVTMLYLIASVLCFATYAIDKRAARLGRQRVAESTLLWLGLVGGWPGAVLAQQWLRHKSAKASFRLRFHLSVLLHCVLLIVLSAPAGALSSWWQLLTDALA